MFKILSNKTIKISRGDDSGRFPLFINRGEHTCPIRYEFKPPVYISEKSANITFIDLNIALFKKKVGNKDGYYHFYYENNLWYYNTEVVNLAEFGITILSQKLQVADYFSITINRPAGESVQFYLFDINSTTQDWLFRKTFSRDGSIISEYPNQIPVKKIDENIISEDGDLMLSFCKEDTDWLKAGEYRYIIRANLVNTITKKVESNTITNRFPFYVIADDFDRTWW